MLVDDLDFSWDTECNFGLRYLKSALFSEKLRLAVEICTKIEYFYYYTEKAMFIIVSKQFFRWPFYATFAQASSHTQPWLRGAEMGGQRLLCDLSQQVA